MPSATYTALQTTTLSSATTTVTFSNLPTTGFRDLVLVISARATQENNRGFAVRYNGDSGANYNYVWGFAFPNSTTSGFENSVTSLPFVVTPGSNTTDYATIVINILDYAATDKHKTGLARTDFIGADARLFMTAGRWANTNAITSIAIGLSANTFASGSTFSLYGIAA